MKGKDLKYILETIENEGFDYTFNDYDDFEGIKDEEFHKLRMKYLQSREELSDYLGID